MAGQMQRKDESVGGRGREMSGDTMRKVVVVSLVGSVMGENPWRLLDCKDCSELTVS